MRLLVENDSLNCAIPIGGFAVAGLRGPARKIGEFEPTCGQGGHWRQRGDTSLSGTGHGSNVGRSQFTHQVRLFSSCVDLPQSARTHPVQPANPPQSLRRLRQARADWLRPPGSRPSARRCLLVSVRSCTSHPAATSMPSMISGLVLRA